MDVPPVAVSEDVLPIVKKRNELLGEGNTPKFLHDLQQIKMIL